MSNLTPELIEAARRVIEANRTAGRRVALAESCTGGLVTAALTEVPGSSDVLDAGFVTYSNEAKRSMLGVAGDVLETFGAVSIATAWGMARGAIERSQADVAVAITGIAGPGGGTEKKPVGTVVFARALKGADPDSIVADARMFEDRGRESIRLQAALCALELLIPGSPGP
ncbi:CinA family protein [Sphingomonas jatrophae]|uniref:Nicotinamide-nucleotide amidase n=1 Tax=Sphingomonas jatrophae TaxID=1166337 RepID=A0A1I6JP50_9SPHN|nr:CinA family protein [Sphingomonas jatrophae]SFR80736.1 nicotinamide-nucleotide amidase [Sphingomonas jatrophae]